MTNNDYVRLYVIGDIHGRLDLLERIVSEIHHDLKENKSGDCLTLTLGDYVDRGDESRGVLDRLAANPFPTAYIGLKGNHEELLEAFLRDPSVARYWRQLGGLATLQSYGIALNAVDGESDFKELSEALQAAIPTQHFQFLASLRTSMTIGKYFFCHAGVRPGIPLDDQRINDLLWIRDEFLRSSADFGKIVVHGHTPVQEPEILPNRINIDTGAFMTGRLTCLVLELKTERLRFLSTA